MEDYKKLADDLRWQADYHRLNRETARRSAGAIENLMIENAALLQIAEKQATMNVTLTNNVLAMDKELHEAKSEINAIRNDLCYMCGNYREAHKGACDRCRWKKEV